MAPSRLFARSVAALLCCLLLATLFAGAASAEVTGTLFLGENQYEPNESTATVRVGQDLHVRLVDADLPTNTNEHICVSVQNAETGAEVWVRLAANNFAGDFRGFVNVDAAPLPEQTAVCTGHGTIGSTAPQSVYLAAAPGDVIHVTYQDNSNANGQSQLVQQSVIADTAQQVNDGTISWTDMNAGRLNLGDTIRFTVNDLDLESRPDPSTVGIVICINGACNTSAPEQPLTLNRVEAGVYQGSLELTAGDFYYTAGTTYRAIYSDAHNSTGQRQLRSTLFTVGQRVIRDLPGCTANVLPRNDDGSTGAVTLPFTFSMFGTEYDQLWVNNNGNVTFDGPMSTYVPFDITQTNRPIIAAFLDDVDTRQDYATPVTYGAVHYNRTPDQAPDAFCVNWVDVAEYGTSHGRTNDIQMLIVKTSRDFEVHLSYDKIDWDRRGAGVGYSAGTGELDSFYELPGSRALGTFLDSAPTGLIHNSQGSLTAGRYVFRLTPQTGGRVHGVVTTEGTESGIAAAPVQVCQVDAEGVPIQGTCVSTKTNSVGAYSVSGRPNGDYTVRVSSPVGADLVPQTKGPFFLGITGEPPVMTVEERNFQMRGAQSPPSGSTVEGIRTTGSGVPVVVIGTEPRISETGCANATSALWRILRQNPDGTETELATGPLTEEPAGSGSYNGQLTLTTTGTVRVATILTCPDDTLQTEAFNIYIDPSGHVRTVGGAPIVGAQVVLYRSDNEEGPYVQVPDGDVIMSPSNRTNPDLTDATGHFGWDVIEGWYKVRVTAPGCHAPGNPDQSWIDSRLMYIPPEVTDLDLRMECGDFDDDGVPDTVDVIDDVKNNTYMYARVKAMLDAGVTGGCSVQGIVLKFCPDVPITRAQMSLFIPKAMGINAGMLPPYAGTFADVPDGQFYSRWAEEMSRQNVTAGCGTDAATGKPRYCPDDSNIRGQMAIFLLRGSGVTGAMLQPYAGTFGDVPNVYYARWVEELARRGITAGCGTNAQGQPNFCPTESITRGQMAIMIQRTFDLPMS